MAVDLVLVALLVNAGGFVFALGTALLFFRLAARGTGGHFLKRSLRIILRGAAAIIVFVVCINLVGKLDGDDEDDARRAELDVERDGGDGVPEPPTAPSGDVAAPASGEEARPTPSRRTPAADSLVLRYAAAVGNDDTTRVDSLYPFVASALADDTVSTLRRRIRRDRERIEELREKLEVARERDVGPLTYLREFAEDMGLGFGWIGLYFTGFIALWRGQTPGKRLLQIRVVRLDGAAITLWGAFERFGGYAASVITGLLGLFQILWDRNRQALHDKVVETVVIYLPPAVPAPTETPSAPAVVFEQPPAPVSVEPAPVDTSSTPGLDSEVHPTGEPPERDLSTCVISFREM